MNHAFDKLWCCNRPGMHRQEDLGPAMDPGNLCTVDGYIQRHFQRVAELSRDSVYQAHEKRVLLRMREDAMKRSNFKHMEELDERIRRARLDDLTVQEEIATLMKIAHANESGMR